MKKEIRLNKELYFINSKKKFTLKDLMMEFNISKSTALRDIISLEDMGVALYAEYGKNGGYKIINHNFLPPIYFTDDEVMSIFFSMQMLEFFLTTPFQSEYELIVTKLLRSLPDIKKKNVEQMQNRLYFNSSQQHKKSPFLKELLMYSIEQKVIKITYNKNKAIDRWIQPLGIQAMDGKWYCPSFDLEKNEYRVFRCDFIIQIEETSKYHPKNLTDFDIRNSDLLKKRSNQSIEFEVQLTIEGVEKFKQRHYPNMKLTESSKKYFIEGWYEPSEINFLTHYLLEFGNSAKILSPNSLIISFKQSLYRLLNSYEQT